MASSLDELFPLNSRGARGGTLSSNGFPVKTKGELVSSVLADVLKAVLKVVIAGVLTLAISVSAAPDLVSAAGATELGALAIAVAVLSTLAPYVPLLSVARYIGDPWGKLADAFIQAGLAAFVTSLIGILNAPDLSTWHSLIVAAVVGALNSGAHAAFDTFTAGKKPFANFGVRRVT